MNRTAVWYKTNGLLRNTILRVPSSHRRRVLLVNEFPKSGGTWLGSMLAEVFGLDFPRNQFPKFTPSVFHGHYINPSSLHEPIILWRDGRDVYVSFYYHCLFYNGIGNATLVDRTRENMQFTDVENIRENLPKFLEYSFSGNNRPSYSWVDFVTVWEGRDCVSTRYETLRVNAAHELSRVAELISERKGIAIKNCDFSSIVDKYSFEKSAQRTKKNSIEEDKNAVSFVRKGLVGGWTEHFSSEATDIFKYFAGDSLISLGYESDLSW